MRVYGLHEYGGPEVLQPIEVEKPAVGPGQVLIKVQGTSVNNADILTRKGSFHAAGGSFPIVPGLDVTGIVEEVGEGVTSLKAGDRVIGFPNGGSYKEYLVLEENLAFAIPDSISVEQAAACGLVTFTAHKLIDDVANFKEGETILIHGAAGSVGNAAVQIAKAYGASKIFGTVRSDEQAEIAREAGVDVVINTKNENFAEIVNANTEGGVDVILDAIGGDVTKDGLTCLANYGRLIVYGGSYYDVDTKLLHGSCRSVRGFSIAATRGQRPWMYQSSADILIPLIAEGKVKVRIAEILPLSQAAEGQRLMEEKKVIGKVVLLAE